jgi:hypothetical protein
MKTVLFRKMLALMMTLVMAMGLSAVATANTNLATDGGGQIVGDGSVINPIINVIVPVNFDFALDPYRITDGIVDGSQVAAVDYAIANTSEVPVEFSIVITATGENTVTFVDTAEEVEFDNVDRAQDIFFAALGASGATLSTTSMASFWAELDDFLDPLSARDEGPYVPFEFAYAGLSTLVPFVPGTPNNEAEGEIAFVLAAAEEGVDLVNTNVASFQFFAVLNPYANWNDANLTVEGNYNFNALLSDTYDEFLTDIINGSLNQLPTAVSVAKFLPAGGTSGNYILTADGKQAIMDMFMSDSPRPALVFNFDAGDKEIAAIQFAAVTWMVPNDGWVYDDVEKTLTLTTSTIGTILGSPRNAENFSWVGTIYFVDDDDFDASTIADHDEMLTALSDGDIANSGFSLRLNSLP